MAQVRESTSLLSVTGVSAEYLSKQSVTRKQPAGESIMAESDDSVVVDHHNDKGKIVTQFLLNTCRLLQPSEHHVWALFSCACTAFAAELRPRTDNEINIALVTGSSAEFFIQPMLSCVGDIDVMCQCRNLLAIP